jgi:Fe-S cluster assembly iron-binding protein IscA
MIHCTPAAAAALDQVRELQGVPSSFGVRLFAARSPQGDVALGLEFAPGPVAGDEVAEEHGTQLIVAAEVADQLAGVTLDVAPSPATNGSSPAQLILRPAPGES